MKKSNLDEMQEQKLMNLEGSACWLAWWALIVVIVAQVYLGGFLEDVLGEIAVFLILSIYLLIGCLRLGIWDRRREFSTKWNLVYSLLASAATGLLTLVRSLMLYGYHGFLASSAVFLIPFVIVFALTFGLISLCGVIYRKRKEKLEQE